MTFELYRGNNVPEAYESANRPDISETYRRTDDPDAVLGAAFGFAQSMYMVDDSPWQLRQVDSLCKETNYSIPMFEFVLPATDTSPQESDGCRWWITLMSMVRMVGWRIPPGRLHGYAWTSLCGEQPSFTTFLHSIVCPLVDLAPTWINSSCMDDVRPEYQTIIGFMAHPLKKHKSKPTQNGPGLLVAAILASNAKHHGADSVVGVFPPINLWSHDSRTVGSRKAQAPKAKQKKKLKTHFVDARREVQNITLLESILLSGGFLGAIALVNQFGAAAVPPLSRDRSSMLTLVLDSTTVASGLNILGILAMFPPSRDEEIMWSSHLLQKVNDCSPIAVLLRQRTLCIGNESKTWVEDDFDDDSVWSDDTDSTADSYEARVDSGWGRRAFGELSPLSFALIHSRRGHRSQYPSFRKVKSCPSPVPLVKLLAAFHPRMWEDPEVISMKRALNEDIKSMEEGNSVFVPRLFKITETVVWPSAQPILEDSSDSDTSLDSYGDPKPKYEPPSASKTGRNYCPTTLNSGAERVECTPEVLRNTIQPLISSFENVTLLQWLTEDLQRRALFAAAGSKNLGLPDATLLALEAGVPVHMSDQMVTFLRECLFVPTSVEQIRMGLLTPVDPSCNLRDLHWDKIANCAECTKKRNFGRHGSMKCQYGEVDAETDCSSVTSAGAHWLKSRDTYHSQAAKKRGVCTILDSTKWVTTVEFESGVPSDSDSGTPSDSSDDDEDWGFDDDDLDIDAAEIASKTSSIPSLKHAPPAGVGYADAHEFVSHRLRKAQWRMRSPIGGTSTVFLDHPVRQAVVRWIESNVYPPHLCDLIERRPSKILPLEPELRDEATKQLAGEFRPSPGSLNPDGDLLKEATYYRTILRGHWRRYVPYTACYVCGKPGFKECSYRITPIAMAELSSSKLAELQSEHCTMSLHFIFVAQLRTVLNLGFRVAAGSPHSRLNHDVIRDIAQYLMEPVGLELGTYFWDVLADMSAKSRDRCRRVFVPKAPPPPRLSTKRYQFRSKEEIKRMHELREEYYLTAVPTAPPTADSVPHVLAQ